MGTEKVLRLVKQILTKLAVVKKPGRRRGVVYRSPRIYLPTKLTDDSCFPFLEGERIKVDVIEDRLVVSRAASGRRGRRRSAGRRSKGRQGSG